MKRLRNILTVVLLALGMLLPATVRAENTVDVKEIVFGHIGDSYEWHITTWGGFAHQQRIAASHHFECGALVSQAPAGKCRSRWFHRVYGDVYHDGER